MILTCPECSTRYKAKSDSIGINGRTVRCKQCSATWFVAAPSEDTLSTPDVLQLADMEAEPPVQLSDTRPEPVLEKTRLQTETEVVPPFKSAGKSADAVMRDKVDAAKRRARMRTIFLIWLIPLTIIAIIALGLLVGRDKVVEHFPGTAPFYNAVGIKTSITGLEIESPIIRIARVNGEQTVIINGLIRNISRETQDLPYLVLSLHTDAGDEVALWRVEFDRADLKSGETINFASEYPNPPIDVRRLKYRLGDDATGFEAPVLNRPAPENFDLDNSGADNPDLEPLE